ncbi:unnamed protein product, partial [Iphiclides podalirius]
MQQVSPLKSHVGATAGRSPVRYSCSRRSLRPCCIPEASERASLRERDTATAPGGRYLLPKRKKPCDVDIAVMTSMGRWHVVLAAVALLTGAGAGAAAEQMQSRAVDTGVDLRIAEAQPVGTTFGRIPVKPGFTYRFNEPPKEFVLDPISGEIKSNVVLDRESVDRYAFVVLSSQPTYPIEVRIRVTDVNDNYPEFPEPSIAVAFSESAAAGTKLLLDAATDKDLGENGIANDYRIVEGDNEGKFRLNVTLLMKIPE